MLLSDLTGYSDDEITGTIVSRVVLLLFKHVCDPDPRHTLPEIVALIGELLKQERGVTVMPAKAGIHQA